MASFRKPAVTDERAEFVARALDLRDAGHDDWLEQACANRVDLREQVREAVEEACEMPALFVTGAGIDRRIGRQIGPRYRIVRRLGAGAMGVVYEADDAELHRCVALKVLRPGLMNEEHAASRFEREALAMAATDHPAIITIHDLGRTDDGEPFIVMELVHGPPLGTIVEDLAGRADAPHAVDGGMISSELGIETHGETSYVRIVARWTADLAAGLSVMHDAGVVHRDIKPSNVIVRLDGQPVLLDFGVALLDDDSSITRGGTRVGTPAYMPPESAHGRGRSSVAGDIYGLSALLYCLLTLRPPYSGTPADVLAGLSTREPTAPSRLHAGLPRDLQAIVEKGMSRKPAGRYANARDLESDLRAFLGHRPVSARPIGLATRAARRLRRSKGTMAAVVALLLVTVVLVGSSLWSDYLDGRRRRWVQLTCALPPNFTILDHGNRAYVHEEDRADLAALLDDAAALCVDPLPTYLLRASFRLDHGDARGAAADMAVIAKWEGTHFAAQLAAAYAAAPEGASSSRAVNLASLPAPRTARGRYLRAYHHLRAGEREDPEALALLDDDVRASLPHAEELRFALLAPHLLGVHERRRVALALYADGNRLEQRVGVRTAATAHFVGYALANMNRFDEALEACRESVQLAPRTHVNRTNAAFAALLSGRIDEALEHLHVAMDVRPNDVKVAESAVWARVAAADFSGAHAAIKRSTEHLGRRAPWWPARMHGAVEIYRALALLPKPGGRGTTAAVASTEVLEALACAEGFFDASRRAGSTSEPTFLLAVAAALAQGDEQLVFTTLATQCVENPRQIWRLEIALRQLPTDLGVDASAAVRLLMESMRRDLSPSVAPSRAHREPDREPLPLPIH